MFPMVTIFEELAFQKLLADFNKEAEEPTLDHYPEDGEFYCRDCNYKTPHDFIGMLGIVRRRPRLIPKIRVVSYRCINCKASSEFKYCPPHTKLEFKEIRNRE